MKTETVFAGIADAFVRPFAKGTLKRFLMGVLFMLIPLAFIIADGDAYAMAAGWKGRLNDRAKLGLKILLVRLLYGAPALLVYGAMTFLGTYYESMPLLVPTVLVFLLSIFVLRFLILSPVAACCLALGAPLKIAANGREMSRVVSASFGRYCLNSLLCGVPLIAPMFFIDRLPLDWQYVAMIPFAALYSYIGAGLFMSCVRRAYGLPQPPRGDAYPAGTARRAAAFGMALILLLTAAPLNTLAAGNLDNPGVMEQPVESGNPVQYTNYKEAYAYYSSRGMLGPHREVSRNSRTGEYYIRDTTMDEEFRHAGEAVIFAADVALDFVPVLGNLKNGLQVNYYIHQAINAKTDEERQAALVAAGYKGVSLLLGGAGSALNAAKAGTGCLWLNTALGASKVEKAVKVLEYVDKGQKAYDGTVNLLTGSDYVSGKELGEALSPNGLVTVGKYFTEKALDDAFTPAQTPRSPIIYIYNDTSGMPSDFQVPVSDSTIQLPTEPDPGIVIVPQQETITPVGTYTCEMQNFYSGAAAVEGVSYTMERHPVVITINEARNAGFDTMTEFTVVTKVSQAGMQMTSKSTTRIVVPAIAGVYNEALDTYTYSHTEAKNVTIETSYSGQGYVDGGGSVTTTAPSEFQITFTLSMDPLTVYDSFVTYRIKGEILIVPQGYSGGTAQQNSASKITFEGSMTRPIIPGR